MTATSPYVFMVILLIRNCMLEGSGDGILYYITPDFTKMQEMQVNLKPLCSRFAIKSELSPGFPQALEIMENLEIHQNKFHAWKNHGI